MINVTKPFLPPFEEYIQYLTGVWQRSWLTNNGPLVNELEQNLKEYLEIPYALFVTNGTTALQFAIKALELDGEIITTPFSYVATTSSIVWEKCTPVFVDIDAETFNIDPSKIEAAITPKTSAIIATHVYGNPCDVEAIDKVAKKHNLKVIYDAAHAFGTTYQGRSIMGCGDISATSFHATKLYHTVEGGGLFTKQPALNKRISHMRNFGHTNTERFIDVGINGKNSEMHAAFGLANLKHVKSIMATRKELSKRYDEKLKNHRSVKQKIQKGALINHCYYPLLFESTELLENTLLELNDNYIFPRRYLYPTLNKLPYVTPADTPVAEDIAKRVVCLPLYHDLKKEEIDMICRILLSVQAGE